jgi:hypothetical protein
MRWWELLLLSPIVAVLLTALFQFVGSVRERVGWWRLARMSPEKRRKRFERESRKTAVKLGATLTVVLGALGELSGPDSRDYLDED